MNCISREQITYLRARKNHYLTLERAWFIFHVQKIHSWKMYVNSGHQISFLPQTEFVHRYIKCPQRIKFIFQCMWAHFPYVKMNIFLGEKISTTKLLIFAIINEFDSFIINIVSSYVFHSPLKRILLAAMQILYDY